MKADERSGVQDLRDELRVLADAALEAQLEVSRLKGAYFTLRGGAAPGDLEHLTPARMLWTLAEIHLVQVRSEHYGVRDRITSLRRTDQLHLESLPVSQGQSVGAEH